MHEMETIQSTMTDTNLRMQLSSSAGGAMKYLKEALPEIFLHRSDSEHKACAAFPKKMEKTKAAAEAKAERDNAVADRERARNRVRVAPTMAEKEADMQEVFTPSPGGHQRHSTYPCSLHVSIAIMLYAQFQMGIPLTASLALPLFIGVISNSGYAHLLHSGQSSTVVLHI